MNDELKKVILVVDDEPELLEIIVEELIEEGYEVLQATSGNDAFEIVKKTSNIGLIFSDIRMINGDGFELLKNVKKLNPDSPKVYLVSGYSDYSEEQILSSGAEALLAKPFNLDKIFEIAEKVIA